MRGFCPHFPTITEIFIYYITPLYFSLSLVSTLFIKHLKKNSTRLLFMTFILFIYHSILFLKKKKKSIRLFFQDIYSICKSYLSIVIRVNHVTINKTLSRKKNRVLDFGSRRILNFIFRLIVAFYLLFLDN